MTDHVGGVDRDAPQDQPGEGRFRDVARGHGAVVRSFERDGGGWRWRVSWRGIEAGAWNDMDGVAVVADIGPADAWVGLQGHPPDPDEVVAMEWAVATLAPWLDVADNARRITERARRR